MARHPGKPFREALISAEPKASRHSIGTRKKSDPIFANTWNKIC
jgi:hypothetical protein